MPTRRDFLTAALSLPVLVGSLQRAAASSPEVFSTHGTAMHGYDPVAYFKTGGPAQGDPTWQLKWMGTIWQFSTAENMQAFEMNPRRFAPHYGGYCAYAMAQGAIATTVPEAWTIVDDRLYLNFSTGVRSIWRRDIPGNITRADGHWPEALNG